MTNGVVRELSRVGDQLDTIEGHLGYLRALIRSANTLAVRQELQVSPNLLGGVGLLVNDSREVATSVEMLIKNMRGFMEAHDLMPVNDV